MYNNVKLKQNPKYYVILMRLYSRSATAQKTPLMVAVERDLKPLITTISRVVSVY